MSQEPFDEIFMQVAGRAGGIQPLLDSFFGFLSRKTDFYVQFEPNIKAKMGFPRGIAERMLLESFHKFPYVEYSGEETKQEDTKPTDPPPAQTRKSSAQNSPSVTTYSAPREESRPVVRVNEMGKQIPIGNGGIGEKHYWTQTLKEATVYIDIGHENIRGKDVQCVIRPRHLSLTVRGEEYLSGELEDAIKVDESMWTISSDSGSQVIITLDKGRPNWWKHILIGDPEIDTTKVDSTQNISEYDEETQATIRRLMHDQKQQRLGLPTSKEEQQEEVLQRAMYAPGSPFLMTQESSDDGATREQSNSETSGKGST